MIVSNETIKDLLLKKVLKNNRIKGINIKFIYFLIYTLLIYAIFEKINEGLTSKVISLQRRGLTPYLVHYDKEPMLFLFSLTFFILLTILFTYLFIEILTSKETVKLANLIPTNERIFHMLMFTLIISPVIFIFLSIFFS